MEIGMLHKIVAVLVFGIALSLALIPTDAMAMGGASGGAAAGAGHGGGLGGAGGFHGGGPGFRGGGFGPGFAGHGFGGRGFNRGFVRDRRFFPGWGWGGGWWGAPGYVDTDLCFAWTPSGYRWACGY
jgi:hypothetical protein